MKNRLRLHLAETQRRRGKFVFFFLVLLIPGGAVQGQDGFGFGESEDFGFGGGGSSGFSVNISGEASAELKFFYDDLSSKNKFGNIQLGDIFLGRLNFEAGNSVAQGLISLKLRPVFDGSSPIEIDEAFVRAFFGPVTLEGGLRKVTWGKADSFGPLDVINPLDYRDLSAISDPAGIKIARPMIRTSWALGSFTKLEAVFVPWFQGHKFAARGRWAPNQITNIPGFVADYIAETVYIASGGLVILPDSEKSIIQNELREWVSSGGVEEFYPNTDILKYAQAGMRFTTSLGSSDFGLQYYFGRLQRPAVGFDIAPDFYVIGATPSISTEKINLSIDYNYYHQIAVDFARVLFGFNIRAEAGVNLTKDLNGKDGAVENPAIVWSLGFDRDMVWGINLNLQGNGRVRLFHDRIGGSFLTDCEAGSKISSSRITAVISRKFFRNELELKATGLWGIEDKDFLVMPAIIWGRNDLSIEASAGFFGGSRKGELGQYSDNGFLRLLVSYKF